MIRFLMAIVLACGAAVAVADDSARVASAKQAYRAGRLDEALEQLEPLLKQDPNENTSVVQARELAAAVLERRGIEHFRRARVEESVRDFDRQVELAPHDADGHWRRGIAYYYAGAYERGRRQFESYQTVDRQDVENAVWHLLCAVRAAGGSFAAAQRNLIPITDDARVPMLAVHRLFAGQATPDDVQRAAADAGKRAQFYADLYVGLYYEARGDAEKSLQHIERAAKNPAADESNMGDVARVHARLRRAPANQNQ